MKFIKKLNIGLVLAIIAILAVIIYSVNIENERKASKQEIKKSCEEFISITDKYYTLPENYQTIGEKSQDVDLTNYYTEMENELKTKTINDSATKLQKTILTEYLKNQLVDTSKITVSFKREITKISEYKFDGNQVTVTFNSKVTIKQKYKDMNIEDNTSKEKVNETTFDTEGDTITLEQKDGVWKIVYADLQFNNINALYNM